MDANIYLKDLAGNPLGTATNPLVVYLDSITAPGTTGDILYNDNGFAAATSTFTFDDVTGTVTATAFVGDGSGLTGIDSGNQTSVNITVLADVQLRRGQAVYITQGASTSPNVNLCDNTNSAKSRILGLALANIAPAATGSIRRQGVINNVDTRRTSAGGNGYVNVDEVWVEGDLLFVTTTGHLSNVRPTSGRVVKAGYTVKGNSSTDSIVVYPLENPVWSTCASTENVVLRAGDDIGATGVSFRNYSNTNVATLNSFGTLTTSGSINIATGKTYQINGSAHTHNESTIVLTDVSTNNVSASAHGFMPKYPNNSITFLRGDGTYAAPPKGGVLSWSEVTGTTQACSVNIGYILNNAALVTATLPSTAAVGDVIRLVGKGAGMWKLAQNASQYIRFAGLSTTTGTGGYLQAENAYDCIEIMCTTANNGWTVISSIGNIVVV